MQQASACSVDQPCCNLCLCLSNNLRHVYLVRAYAAMLVDSSSSMSKSDAKVDMQLADYCFQWMSVKLVLGHEA